MTAIEINRQLTGNFRCPFIQINSIGGETKINLEEACAHIANYSRMEMTQLKPIPTYLNGLEDVCVPLVIGTAHLQTTELSYS